MSAHTSTTTITNVEIKERLLGLLEMLRSSLNEYDYNAAHVFMAEDAYTLTYEHICEQLYEFQTAITAQLYTELEDLGRALGYQDESHWRELASQVM